VKYLAILSILDDDTDFTETLTSSIFINEKFNENYLGAYQILEKTKQEFDPVNLSNSLSNFLISALDITVLSDNKIHLINALLDAILYFSITNKAILSILANNLTQHKDERLIRIFEHNLEQNNYRKAAQWLYLFFLCHPNALSFTTTKYNDSEEEYLQNFVKEDNENYQIVINELFSFFADFNIDYLTWFSGISIQPNNVNFFVSLINQFNQNDNPSLNIDIEWLVRHWNTIKTLSE
jgi:hypothetical protein